MRDNRAVLLHFSISCTFAALEVPWLWDGGGFGCSSRSENNFLPSHTPLTSNDAEPKV